MKKWKGNRKGKGKKREEKEREKGEGEKGKGKEENSVSRMQRSQKIHWLQSGNQNQLLLIKENRAAASRHCLQRAARGRIQPGTAGKKR